MERYQAAVVRLEKARAAEKELENIMEVCSSCCWCGVGTWKLLLVSHLHQQLLLAVAYTSFGRGQQDDTTQLAAFTLLKVVCFVVVLPLLITGMLCRHSLVPHTSRTP